MEPKTFDDEVEIDIRELLYVFRRKALLVAAVGLLVGCLTCAFTKFFLKPVYTSTSSMLVLTKETTLASLADLQMGSQLTKDYRELIMSRPVLEEVIENLGLETGYDDFLETITIDNPTDTRILRISVENQDAQLAAEIVNELCSIASDFIGDKMEVAPPKIIEEGQIPTVKTRPSMIRNTLIGMLVGGLAVCGILVFHDRIVDVIQRKCRQRKIIPSSTSPTHQEGFQSGTGQYLPCAAASIIIDTLTGNAYRIGGNINFNIFFPIFFVKIYTNNNTHGVSDLIGYIFKELVSVGQADHITVIVTADIDFTALCVGITANPFQIFVFPFAFPFVWFGIFSLKAHIDCHRLITHGHSKCHHHTVILYVPHGFHATLDYIWIVKWKE